MYEFYTPLVGQGIFNCKDGKVLTLWITVFKIFEKVSRWRRNRKLIATTFNQRMLNSFMPIFEEQSLIFREKLKEMEGKGIFDVNILLSRCHVDIICGNKDHEINVQCIGMYNILNL